MIVTKKYPITEEELLELGPGMHRFRGTFEEFLDVIEQTELKVEFSDEHLVFMGLASDPHEVLTAQILIFLGGLLQTRYDQITARGSNQLVYIPNHPKAFQPDSFFVNGEPQYKKEKKKPKMVTNPWLVIEVLSESTKNYDLGTKLPAYKQLPSVEYILYAQQDEPKMTLHTRQSASRWNSQDFDLERSVLNIAEVELDLKIVYRRLGLVP